MDGDAAIRTRITRSLLPGTGQTYGLFIGDSLGAPGRWSLVFWPGYTTSPMAAENPEAVYKYDS
jgi:hypothetical protein